MKYQMQYQILESLAEKLIEVASRKQIMIATAESCTGGMLSSAITAIPGSSVVYDRGFITYSYESKTELLDVDKDMIIKLGAVSKEVAVAMACGAMKKSKAKLTVGITGIAGPGGSTPTKPVGLVYIATMFDNKVIVTENFYSGDRNEIRIKSVETAIKMMLERLEEKSISY